MVAAVDRVIRRRPDADPAPLVTAGLHPLLARLYAARGIQDPDDLDLSPGRLLPPDTLAGALDAAIMLADAMAEGDHLLIVGDFDADGATSTAVAISALREMGAEQVSYLVPNRFEFGYGLTPEIVALAAQRSPQMIITVDNGISSVRGVAAAKKLGIATLVTDHHLPGAELPVADVIVNPNQAGCLFASKSLAGVGVIFYVMLALRAELRRRDWFERRGTPEPNLARHLDLVALGTVADVVPLDRNNRILVEAGLKRMRAGLARPGIQSLLQVAGRSPASLVASDLGFALGPRLNAAGRLDDMSIGIECLLSEHEFQARPLAEQLHQLNQDRRLIEQGMQDDAMASLESLSIDAANPPLAMTLYDPGWHQGVVGILASRVKDRLHRPVIAFADGDNGEIKGSARSIPGLHIRDVLDAIASRHPGLVTKFGGHAMAAGLSLARADYEQFASAFNEEVTRHAGDVELQAHVESDGELNPVDFNLDMASALRLGGPWGQHFPEPVFDGEFNLVQQRIVGGKHLKLVLSPADSDDVIDAIAFNIDTSAWPNAQAQRVCIAFRLDVNEFRGQRSVQLMVEQIRPC